MEQYNTTTHMGTTSKVLIAVAGSIASVLVTMYLRKLLSERNFSERVGDAKNMYALKSTALKNKVASKTDDLKTFADEVTTKVAEAVKGQT